jgi:hypothetical protein
MAAPSLITRREVKRAITLLVALVLIAAAINVPCAMTRMRWFAEQQRTSRGTLRTQSFWDSQIPREWPSSTPHATPWPAPNGWDQTTAFGVRTFNVFGGKSANGRNGFQMEVEHYGWPLPVLEDKAMWWDWEDPKLNGPEPDPPISLMYRGALLNPIIVGGALWLPLIIPLTAIIVFKRNHRRRRNQCINCGYPRGEGNVCTECGTALNDC